MEKKFLDNNYIGHTITRLSRRLTLHLNLSVHMFVRVDSRGYFYLSSFCLALYTFSLVLYFSLFSSCSNFDVRFSRHSVFFLLLVHSIVFLFLENCISFINPNMMRKIFIYAIKPNVYFLVSFRRTHCHSITRTNVWNVITTFLSSNVGIYQDYLIASSIVLLFFWKICPGTFSDY